MSIGILYSRLSLYHIILHLLFSSDTMQFRKYTKEQLIKAVKSSFSIRQVLIKLNVAPQGGNYDVIRRYIKKLNLDTSHFLGQGWSKNKKINRDKPIEYYLSNKLKMQSNSLRKRLLKDNIFEYKCYKCNLTTWQGQKIPLELDHINGIRDDNSLSNLILLCPNCHAQTSTYRGKN